MTEEQKKNNRLLNRLIIYMGSSDDLIFWVLTDVLYLSAVKGFTGVEISMVFTGAFWGSLIPSFPYYLLMKRLRTQTAMVINQVLFLIASFMLLISQTVAAMIIAQSIYFLAASSFNISDILMHDLCRKSAGSRDFVTCRSQRAGIYAILSLIFAFLIYPLMQVDGSLPMIIETCLTAGSCVLAILIARDTRDMVPYTKEAPNTQGSTNPETRISAENSTGGRPAAASARKLLDIGDVAYSKTTWTYIVLAILVGTFLTVFMTNGKILLNDDIALIYGAGRATAIFSGVIIVTRVTRIIGNAIPRLMHKKVKKYQGIAVAVVSILPIAMALVLLSFSHLQSSPILVSISIAIVCTVFDPLYNTTRYLFLNGLSGQQELSAIYIVNLAGNILNSVLSSIITLLLVSGTMLDVMQILTLVAVITLLISLLGLYFYRRRLSAGKVKS